MHPMSKTSRLPQIVLLLFALSAWMTACRPIQSTGSATDPSAAAADSVVRLTLLHLNDVYEIMPVSGGKLGGLARVTTLRQRLAAANPNTFVTFAGDLYTPSGLSSAIVDGSPVDGEQAVAVMNTVGIDYMTFGDHEFHVRHEDEFYARLAETRFPILSSNVTAADGEPFPGVAANAIFTATNPAGNAMRVGIFGVTEPIGKTPVAISYLDPMEATAAQVETLRDQVDLLIALTHFHVTEDEALAQAFPEIDLIVGGDDHEHMAVSSGTESAPIYKSDSNARNVYVLELTYDTATAELKIEAALEPITDAIADDPNTRAVANEWVERIFDAYRAEGIDPAQEVATTPVDLDGFATSIRNFPTALTHLVANGMLALAPDADAAFYPSGFLRLDDLIPAGSTVTQYDLIRMFPNDFTLVPVEMAGADLIGWLDYSRSLAGFGNYLLTSDNLHFQEATQRWELNGETMDPDKIYQMVAPQDALDPSLAIGEKVGTLRQALLTQLHLEALR